MRSATFMLLAVAVISVAAVVVFRPNPGAKAERAKRERANSGLLYPVPPEAVALRARWRVKRDLAKRIALERIPLLPAAAMFEEANGEEGIQTLTLGTLGRSLREKLCRQVIDYVATTERELESGGHRLPRPLVSEELQREFDRRMAAGEFPPDPGR